VRGELLDDLLDARDREPRLLRERAARLGANLDTAHTVLVARPVPEGRPRGGDSGEADLGRERPWSAASHLAATRHGLAASRHGGWCCCCPWGPTTRRRPPRRWPPSGWARPPVC